jgi:recombinational DNA repair protein RecT
MGYSTCFLVKNGQKYMFFAPLKLIENNLKGVKMTQNPSKAWAIVHAFWSKMAKNTCFLHL